MPTIYGTRTIRSSMPSGTIIRRSYPSRPRSRYYQTKLKKGRYKGPHMRLYKQIRAITLSQAETKTSSQRFWSGTDANPLYHNQTNYRMCNLLATSQGLSNNPGLNVDTRNRVGAKITLRGLSLKFLFITAQSRPNLNVMGYVFWYDSDLVNPHSNPQILLDDAGFWTGADATGASFNRLLDKPNPNKNIKIIKRFYVSNMLNYSTVVPSGDERNNTILKEMYIPLKNRQIRYDDTGSSTTNTIPVKYDIGVALVAFDTTNTGTGDIVGYVTAQSTLYYKDM